MARKPNRIPLTIIRGETRVERITFFKANGKRQPLTGGTTVHLRVKLDKDDPDEDAILDLETGDGIEHEADQSEGAETEGQALITFSTPVTLEFEQRVYVYDAWAVDGMGNAQPGIDPSPLEVVRGVYSPPAGP